MTNHFPLTSAPLFVGCTYEPISIHVSSSNALAVSPDYLVGKTQLELDDLMLRRVKAVSKMRDKDKDHVFSLLDTFIAKTQM
jgi:hypothetical protein